MANSKTTIQYKYPGYLYRKVVLEFVIFLPSAIFGNPQVLRDSAYCLALGFAHHKNEECGLNSENSSHLLNCGVF